MVSFKNIVMAGMLLALATACDRSDDSRVTEPVDEAAAGFGEGGSIMRPDAAIETPEAPEPLQPLRAVVPFAEVDDSELSAAARAELQNILTSEQLDLGGDIVLRGHSDAGGSDAVNMRASENRAELVKEWLVENGVDKKRITIIAFGEQNPFEPNANPDGTPNEAGRQANQRVEVTVALPTTSIAAEPAAAESTAQPAAAHSPNMR